MPMTTLNKRERDAIADHARWLRKLADTFESIHDIGSFDIDGTKFQVKSAAISEFDGRTEDDMAPMSRALTYLVNTHRDKLIHDTWVEADEWIRHCTKRAQATQADAERAVRRLVDQEVV